MMWNTNLQKEHGGHYRIIFDTGQFLNHHSEDRGTGKVVGLLGGGHPSPG